MGGTGGMGGLCLDCIHQAICDFQRGYFDEGETVHCVFHEERKLGDWKVETAEETEDLPKVICSHCNNEYFVGEDDIFDFRQEWVYCPKCGYKNGGEKK